MKPTVLDMTQTILSALSSDEVNSISDTTESMQVAECLKTSFFNMMSRIGLEQNETIFQLDSSTDVLQPVLMYKPDNVSRIEWIKYLDEGSTANPPSYNYVTILPAAQFMDMVSAFNTDETNIEPWSLTVNGRVFNVGYYTDRTPRFCCILENYYILFDGFDSAVDDTLQTHKTMCSGLTTPTWRMEDTFIPDLEDNQFPLLLNEAKSLAFFELKQSVHPKAEQEAKRGWSVIQRNKSVTNRPTYFDALPDFGRRSNAGVSYFKSRGWDR